MRMQYIWMRREHMTEWQGKIINSNKKWFQTWRKALSLSLSLNMRVRKQVSASCMHTWERFKLTFYPMMMIWLWSCQLAIFASSSTNHVFISWPFCIYKCIRMCVVQMISRRIQWFLVFKNTHITTARAWIYCDLHIVRCWYCCSYPTICCLVHSAHLYLYKYHG